MSSVKIRIDEKKGLGLRLMLIKALICVLFLCVGFPHDGVSGYSKKDPGASGRNFVRGSSFNIEDCRSMEECEVYYNTSDPLRDAILLNEEEPRPCLLHGDVKASSNWFGYLANGTLAANVARFYYRIMYPEEKCCIKLLLYLEEQVSALRAHMNCLQRTSIIATNPKQIITLSPSMETSGCTANRTYNGRSMIECNSGRILRSNSDQTWHFAASSCGSPTGLSMTYSIVLYGLRSECPDETSAAVCSIHQQKLHHLIPSAVAMFYLLFLHWYYDVNST